MELNKYIRQAAKNILSEQGFDEGFRVSQNPTYGQGFDDRLKKAGGFSDEEMDDITSRDVGSSFPGSEQNDLPDFDENDVKNIEDEVILYLYPL